MIASGYGCVGGAEDALDDVIVIALYKPTSRSRWFMYGCTDVLRRVHVLRSLRRLDESLTADPGNFWAHGLTGLIHQGQAHPPSGPVRARLTGERMSRQCLALTVLMSVCVFGAIGCERSPEVKKARHLEQGKQYFKEKRYNDAVIEYRNVLQLDPDHAQAVSRLGAAYYQLGRIELAYPFLLKTVERDATNR